MFELADSGSSGGLPLPLFLFLSFSLFPSCLSSPPVVCVSLSLSVSLYYLSTCYATPCHAALAQVCATA